MNWIAAQAKEERYVIALDIEHESKLFHLPHLLYLWTVIGSERGGRSGQGSRRCACRDSQILECVNEMPRMAKRGRP